MSLTVAVYQGSAELGNKEHNITKMKKIMMEARRELADVIVFPELFSTGYHLPHNLAKELAESKSGFTFTELSTHAKSVGIAVLYGYPEQGEDGKYYNSAQFIDKEGKSLGNYRKTHLWIDETKTETVYTPGEGIEIFDYGGFKIGLLICYDVEFSEMVRLLAVQDVEVVMAPVAVAKDAFSGLSSLTDLLVPSHAYENRVHIVYVNFSGGVFWGNSKIFDSAGKKLLDLGEKDEGVYAVVIKKNSVCSNHV